MPSVQYLLFEILTSWHACLVWDLVWYARVIENALPCCAWLHANIWIWWTDGYSKKIFWFVWDDSLEKLSKAPSLQLWAHKMIWFVWDDSHRSDAIWICILNKVMNKMICISMICWNDCEQLVFVKCIC